MTPATTTNSQCLHGYSSAVTRVGTLHVGALIAQMAFAAGVVDVDENRFSIDSRKPLSRSDAH